jgi:phosphate starvation-inducible PhoH-like protein
VEILGDVDGVLFTFFTPNDVVRHELVQRIVEAYESDDNGGSQE